MWTIAIKAATPAVNDAPELLSSSFIVVEEGDDVFKEVVVDGVVDILVVVDGVVDIVDDEVADVVVGEVDDEVVVSLLK